MCSALFSVHGLKNEVYSCVACLFRFMDKRTRYIDVWRACFGSWIKERVIFMCSALISVHGLKNEFIFMCSALVSAHGIKESWFFAYRSRKIQFMTFVLRCRFQWLTNRLPTFPFVPMVPMVPIDHSFSQGLQVLMRCSLQMVYRSTEELTIRSNGTNRKASLTNRNLLPMVPLVRVF